MLHYRYVALRFAIVLALSVRVSTASARTTLIRAGTVLDGRGHITSNATILVENGRIVRIGPADLPAPPGAAVFDLRRLTVIPGLIDAHTHMTYFWDQAPGTRPWAQAASRPPAETVYLAQENARKTLETGVTTVRDLGAADYSDIAMRNLVARGAMVGPRMLVSGYGLFATSAPARPGTAADPGQADGVAEVLRVVRQQIGAGADCVKMYGSTGSDQDVTGYQTFTFDEMRAAVEIAHKLGKKIAIHSYGPDGARDAVRAGADSVEHATDMDDDTIADMVKRKTFYVPTIDHNRYYVEYHEQFGYGPDVTDRLNAYIARNLETARRAFKAGVRFAMGSDAVLTGFGQNTRELAWFIKAGMTPQQALATATTNAAALLGLEGRIGAIDNGYEADLVAVDGDPLADINVVIEKVRWVMKGGKVVVDRTK